jgi:hypothetical protein
MDKGCPFCGDPVIAVYSNPYTIHMICQSNHMWLAGYRKVDVECPICKSSEKVYQMRIPFYQGREAYHKYSIPAVNNYYECHNCKMPENSNHYYCWGFTQEIFPSKRILNKNYNKKYDKQLIK